MAVVESAKRELIYVNEDKVIPAQYESPNDGELVWYLDTGATNHMTGNRRLFSALNTSVGGKVRFGDNSSVEIKGRGSILLECKNGEQRLLTDILYIPYLKANVFSIGQAEEGGCQISIKDGILSIFEQNGMLSIAYNKARSTDTYPVKDPGEKGSVLLLQNCQLTQLDPGISHGETAASGGELSG
ncbi:hypothetical protein E3N88_15230 [Mikania micrantha]|uniref:Retrovirus-related Pol polyprotein from transposon TNT 1-94-like beta-barrel domain-containing protein n=1 Tax=Mikania micrantha TaxID=192012 RepID=A0A5N6NUT7_9ASTR|nr:hypothetical protein E3N88_15230 [Mikania micrantha]